MPALGVGNSEAARVDHSMAAQGSAWRSAAARRAGWRISPLSRRWTNSGFSPSVIAGTSIGALIGAGWASGMTGTATARTRYEVLGTMQAITGRLWTTQTRDIWQPVSEQAFRMQLDAEDVVDAFCPTGFPIPSRICGRRFTSSPPISRPGTRWCSTPARCSRPSPPRSPCRAFSSRAVRRHAAGRWRRGQSAAARHRLGRIPIS